mgnify:CR=1 FL=1
MADEWDEFGNLDGNSDDSNDDGDNDEFDVSKLTPVERKRYDKMKKDVESSIVEVLAKGDSNSDIYKGMQRALAQRDRELAEYKAKLANVDGRTGNVEDKAAEVDFLYSIVHDMLDSDGQRALEARKEQFTSTKSAKKNEALLKEILEQRTAPTHFPYGQVEETAEQTQYRKDAETKLKNLAKMAGVDPTNKDLDMGDISEPLLTRIGKLESSIERLKDKDISSVRENGNRTNTRTDTSSPRREAAIDAVSLLERGSLKMVEEARKARRA